MTQFLSLVLLVLMSLAAYAGDQAGDFDYYVLSLSWSPTWCSETGDDRDADQCDIGRKTDFIVHGLWPQYERGWPQDCNSVERDPSRRQSNAMADLMGSGGLAWYQWKKHGRCTGLTAADYYQATRDAAEKIVIPPVFDDLDRDIRLPPAVVEEAFIEANPLLERDGVTITCRSAALQEVRICLTRDLEPRKCGPDIRSDCALPRILMEQVR
ncbi:ribonuclease T2 family protein [Paracoccus seriniphilus]|uniref:Ribonuclease T2 n=1 Tax=Paracoccus seriniphilus TaxID=184748 RepID=A0A239PSY5_9RHOB|nr:ribonuclease T2 [Paracoccus seriniphilus]WCR14274.1 ribonuclease T2 [Paracoccus seriniphilus]SNT73026.1 ribonuclease T2 [Paracoccus seriniphilus]